MDELATTTEAPGVVADTSPAPLGMSIALTISVFAVVTWGFMHVFGTHRRNAE